MSRPTIYINAVGLSTRVTNCLWRNGIQTLNHLADMDRSLLRALPNFGARAAREVEEAIARHPEATLITALPHSRGRPRYAPCPDRRRAAEGAGSCPRLGQT